MKCPACKSDIRLHIENAVEINSGLESSYIILGSTCPSCGKHLEASISEMDWEVSDTE